MGFLGGDNEPSQGEELANQQLAMNKAELERKRQSLFKTRLDIIKGQGAQNWTPEKNSPKGNSSPPFDGIGFFNNS